MKSTNGRRSLTRACARKLKEGPYNKADKEDEYHVEVDLLESRDDYVHVTVAVCSERVPWSCIHPLCRSFLVYRNGRVDK